MVQDDLQGVDPATVHVVFSRYKFSLLKREITFYVPIQPLRIFSLKENDLRSECSST